MVASSKNAKVASKNNPTSRGSQNKMYFQNQEVIPVRYIGSFVGKGGVYMAMMSLSGDLLVDNADVPYKWNLAQPVEAS